MANLAPHFRQRNTPGTPLEQVPKRAHDAGGRVTAKTAPKGRTTRFEYDALGRKARKIDPAGGITKYRYDDRDNLLKVTNARGIGIRRFKYDRAGRRTAVIWPGGETVNYRYDAAGNMIEKLNARGQAIRHSYDAIGRRVKSAYHSDPAAAADRTETFSYDAAGRLTAYTGSTTSGTYTYDDAGRRTGATIDYGAFTKSYGYTYFANGKKQSFTAPDGTTYSYRYDEGNRLKGIKIPGLGEITYHDYQWMRPTRVSRPGGGAEKQSFDRLMRVKEIRALDPAGNPLMDYDYTYDAGGNITKKVTEHGDYTYAYDQLDRLTKAENPVPLEDEAYSYDPVGNRKTDAQVPGEWSYNQADQLTTYGKYDQEFDADGNLVKKTNTETGTVTEYQYNVAGRLVEVIGNGNTIATYVYDPFGRRIKKKISDDVKYFLYSEEGLIGELGNKGEVVQSYGFQPNSLWTTDPVFTRLNGRYAFFLNDHIGSPKKLFLLNGDALWSSERQSFGGNNKNNKQQIVFPGHYDDEETNLYYNFRRFYSPEKGRFIRPDPIGAIINKKEQGTKNNNLYSYAKNNPLKYIDPYGLHYFRSPFGGYKPHTHDYPADCPSCDVDFGPEGDGMLDPDSPDHYELPKCITCDKEFPACIASTGTDSLACLACAASQGRSFRSCAKCAKGAGDAALCVNKHCDNGRRSIDGECKPCLTDYPK